MGSKSAIIIESLIWFRAVKIAERLGNSIYRRQRVGDYETLAINGRPKDHHYKKLKKCLCIQGVVMVCLVVTAVGMAAGFGATIII